MPPDWIGTRAQVDEACGICTECHICTPEPAVASAVPAVCSRTSDLPAVLQGAPITRAGSRCHVAHGRCGALPAAPRASRTAARAWPRGGSAAEWAFACRTRRAEGHPRMYIVGIPEFGARLALDPAGCSAQPADFGLI